MSFALLLRCFHARQPKPQRAESPRAASPRAASPGAASPGFTRAVTRRPILSLCVAAIFSASVAQAETQIVAPPKLPHCQPAEAGFNATRLEAIKRVVQEGLDAQRMPGCVIAFGRGGKLAWLKAYGNRQVEPSIQPMTTDTVFDMASITKPVATATSVMILVEQGRVRLRDRFSDYFPEFAANGKKDITVTQLLTHHGGLIPDNAVADYDHGRQEAWKRILNLDTYVDPGSRFVYTDVGFIALAELIRDASGMDVHQFSQQHLFKPLGMAETGYLPSETLRARAAKTEQREERWMQGEVHDPRAYRLDGIAGHAGLFSTAEDLAIYAQMMLGDGQYHGVRILSPAMVRVMTQAYDVSGNVRGLGWDKLSVYSSNRGETFSDSAFGHGGFTGTVLWIDPQLDLFFIFLSNRVHPNGKGNVNSLAGRVATIIAGAIEPKLEVDEHGQAAAAPIADRVSTDHPQHSMTRSAKAGQVKTGLDVLRDQQFAALANQRVGLITNHTGIDRHFMTTIEVLRQAKQVELMALFSPEHGIAGKLDEANIADDRDAGTGLQVFSLYGKSRKPTEAQLANVDTLVFDIQDIGTRFYTYISTMGLAMQAAAEHGKRFVVLDRPNPIGGVAVDGPVLDEGRESFVGFHTLPVRHGMTVGELALMFRAELHLDLDLEVVQVANWNRGDYFDQTALPWINPSPNMRNLNQAILYPGIGLLETTNLSVGRGTDTPFEWFGAPWIDEDRLASELNARGLGGVRFVPCRFTPSTSVFANELCHGVQIMIHDRDQLNPLDIGLTVAVVLRLQYPDAWEFKKYDRLLGDAAVLQAVTDGASPSAIRAAFEAELAGFCARRARYVLYR